MEKLISVNELSLNFNLREPKGNKCTNVYAVVRCGSVQLKFAIGCKVNSWQWSGKQQMPTITNAMTNEDREHNTIVMSVISAIRFGYSNFFSYLCKEHTTVSVEEIKDRINNIINETRLEEMANNENLRKSVERTPKATTLLNKAFEIYYTEISKVKESAKVTAYSQLKAYLNYCEEIGKDKLSMLTQRGLNDYKSYLMNKSKEDEKNGCARYDSNTQINNKCQAVARYINKVLSVHNDFLRYKIEKVVYQNLEEVNPKNEEKKRRPLTDEELTKLIECDGLTAEEKEYRDLFLLECYCAYRVGDTPKLFDKKIQKHYEKDGYELIMIETQKENIDAVIWVNDAVKQILNRYETGFKYAKPTERTYSQKLNYRLKAIAKKAGLDTMERYTDGHNKKVTQPLYEILSSHFARYTFIYNGLFKLGLTPNELKDFTGHANDKMINECYAIYTKADKFNKAVKALERISNASITTIQANTNDNSFAYDKGIQDEKERLLRETKQVLVFLGAKYVDIADIDNIDVLLPMVYIDYHRPLEEMGISISTLKEIYNRKNVSLKEKRQALEEIISELPK